MNLKINATKIWLMIIISLCMLLWKAFYLIILGNPYLMPVAAFFSIGICYSWIYKKRSGVKLIKAWGIILMVYAIVRSLLAFTISLDLGGVEAYIINQIDLWLHVMNLIIFVSGLLILKKRRLIWGFS